MIGRVAAGVLTVACLALPAAATGTPLRFAQPRRLPGAAGSSEPQLAVGPDGTRYAITGSNTTDSSAPGALAVFRNTGGGWTSTAVPGGSRVVGPDVAVTVASSGRLVALEEDSAALSLVVSYSDDRGATWRASSGLQELADQDRPWLSAGPDDTVNLLYHNGFSSNATHNMYVESSTDGGATFGAPVPLTLPGSAPFLDLLCADSGGPSALLQNPTTGRLYAVWGSRHGPVGGCGVLPLTPFTLVPDNRVWVATSPTGAAGTWTSHLAVDYSADGNVVGMQLSPAALDTAGNLWLAWTTPPHGFPDDSGAGIAVRRADPTLKHWTAPRQVIANRQPGIVVPQLVAGDPGRIGLLYLRGATKGSTTSWYPTVSTVIGSAVTTTRLSGTPSYVG
ncbi:MAG: BNR/Asp-box repeat protein, partial [Frankiales bacterium]|nr:BNR/Asp-box repeat protein [Frankiales bacterium]